MTAPCQVIHAGLLAYDDALALQNRLVAERSLPGGIDRLIVVQHPHVYTLGTSGHEDNLLWDAAERTRRGVEVRRVDRGGDITYHGPGQIVGYPILQLPKPGEDGFRIGAVGHVRAIEAMIIALIAEYGITGYPIPGLTGVWVNTPTGDAKICAIGVRVNVRAVTKHGFALNVNTNLDYFTGIIPCGIDDKGVTSLSAVLGQPVDLAEVTRRLIDQFARTFDRAIAAEFIPAELPPLRELK